VPIVRIDDVTVGQGRPGPVTNMLKEGYQSFVLRRAEKI
jgi:hypothetical protein